MPNNETKSLNVDVVAKVSGDFTEIEKQINGKKYVMHVPFAIDKKSLDLLNSGDLTKQSQGFAKLSETINKASKAIDDFGESSGKSFAEFKKGYNGLKVIENGKQTEESIKKQTDAVNKYYTGLIDSYQKALTRECSDGVDKFIKSMELENRKLDLYNFKTANKNVITSGFPETFNPDSYPSYKGTVNNQIFSGITEKSKELNRSKDQILATLDEINTIESRSIIDSTIKTSEAFQEKTNEIKKSQEVIQEQVAVNEAEAASEKKVEEAIKKTTAARKQSKVNKLEQQLIDAKDAYTSDKTSQVKYGALKDADANYRRKYESSTALNKKLTDEVKTLLDEKATSYGIYQSQDHDGNNTLLSQSEYEKLEKVSYMSGKSKGKEEGKAEGNAEGNAATQEQIESIIKALETHTSTVTKDTEAISKQTQAIDNQMGTLSDQTKLISDQTKDISNQANSLTSHVSAISEQTKTIAEQNKTLIENIQLTQKANEEKKKRIEIPAFDSSDTSLGNLIEQGYLLTTLIEQSLQYSDNFNALNDALVETSTLMLNLRNASVSSTSQGILGGYAKQLAEIRSTVEPLFTNIKLPEFSSKQGTLQLGTTVTKEEINNASLLEQRLNEIRKASSDASASLKNVSFDFGAKTLSYELQYIDSATQKFKLSVDSASGSVRLLAGAINIIRPTSAINQLEADIEKLNQRLLSAKASASNYRDLAGLNNAESIYNSVRSARQSYGNNINIPQIEMLQSQLQDGSKYIDSFVVEENKIYATSEEAAKGVQQLESAFSRLSEIKGLNTSQFINSDSLSKIISTMESVQTAYKASGNNYTAQDMSGWTAQIQSAISEYEKLISIENQVSNKQGNYAGFKIDTNNLDDGISKIKQYIESIAGLQKEENGVGTDTISYSFGKKSGEINSVLASIHRLKGEVDSFKVTWDSLGNVRISDKLTKAFDNTSGLDKLRTKYNDLKTTLNELSTNKNGTLGKLIDTSNLSTVLNDFEALQTSIKNIGTSANKQDLEKWNSEINRLQEELGKLTNASNQITNKKGTLLQGFEIDNNTIQNASALKSRLKEIAQLQANASGSSIGNMKYNDSLKQLTVESTNAIGEVTKLTYTLDQENNAARVSAGSTTQSATAFEKFNAALKNKATALATYLTTFVSFYAVWNQMQQGFTTMKDINSDLTTINMTMPVTSDELNQVRQSAIQMGQDLGQSASEVLDAMKIYANANETATSITQKAKSTVMLSNASGQDTATSANQIQAVANQFKDMKGKEDEIVNTYESISSKLAIDFGQGITDMADAVERGGSLADQAGMSFERFAAMTGTVAEKTRLSGETIGTAFKTMFARISRSKSAADEDVTAEDMSDAAKAYAQLGIQIYNADGSMQDISTTLDQLSAKWSTLTDAQKAYIAEQSAGVRGISVFEAAMNSYAEAMQYANEATMDKTNSFSNGVQEKYMESTAAKIETLKSKVTEFWSGIFNSQNSGALVDMASGVMDLVNKIGLLPTALAAVNAAMTFNGGGVLSFTKNSSKNGLQISSSSIVGDIIKRRQQNQSANIVNLSSAMTQNDLNQLKAINQEFMKSGMTGSEWLKGATENGQKFSKVNTEVITSLKAGQSATEGAAVGESTYGASEAVTTGKTIALTAAQMALNAAISLGITALISLVAVGVQAFIDNVINAEQTAIDKGNEAKQTISDINDEFNKSKDIVDNSTARYAELASGLKNNGYGTNENETLNTTDYAELMNIQNEIAAQFPTLVSGYDSEGNAILKMGTNGQTAAEQLQSLLKVQRDIANQKISDELPTLYKGVQAQVNQLEREEQDLQDKASKEKTKVNETNNSKFTFDRSGGQTLNDYNKLGYYGLKVDSSSNDSVKYLNQVEESARAVGIELNRTFGQDASGQYYQMLSFVGATKEQMSQLFKETVKYENLKPADNDKAIESYNQALYDISIKQSEIKQKWAELLPSVTSSLQTSAAFNSLSSSIQDSMLNALGTMDFSNIPAQYNDDLESYIKDTLVFPISRARPEVQKEFANLFDNSITSSLSAQEYKDQINKIADELFSSQEDKDNFKIRFGFEFKDDDGKIQSTIDKKIEDIQKAADARGFKIDTKFLLNNLSSTQLDSAYNILINDNDKTITSYHALEEQMNSVSSSLLVYSADLKTATDSQSKFMSAVVDSISMGTLTADDITAIQGVATNANTILKSKGSDLSFDNSDFFRNSGRGTALNYRVANQAMHIVQSNTLGQYGKDVNDATTALSKANADLIKAKNDWNTAVQNGTQSEVNTAKANVKSMTDAVTNAEDTLETAKETYASYSQSIISYNQEIIDSIIKVQTSIGTAFTDSNSASGMTADDFTAIENVLSEVNSYGGKQFDYSEIFKADANGIQLNTENARELIDTWQQNQIINSIQGIIDANDNLTEAQLNSSEEVMSAYEDIKRSAIQQFSQIEQTIKQYNQSIFDDMSNTLDNIHSAMGTALDTEAIDNIKNAFEGLDGYNPSKLFVATANGIMMDSEAANDLQDQFNHINMAKLQMEIEATKKTWKDYLASGGSSSDQISQVLESQYNNAVMLSEQYAGLTSSLNAYKNALETPDSNANYKYVGENLDTTLKEYEAGWTGTDQTRALAEYLKPENMNTDDAVTNLKNLTDTFKQFYTVNDDNEVTTDGLKKLVSVAESFNDETDHSKWIQGDWGNLKFNIDDIDEFANHLGLSADATEDLIFAMDSAGQKTNTVFPAIADKVSTEIDRVSKSTGVQVKDIDNLQNRINNLYSHGYEVGDLQAKLNQTIKDTGITPTVKPQFEVDKQSLSKYKDKLSGESVDMTIAISQQSLIDLNNAIRDAIEKKPYTIRVDANTSAAETKINAFEQKKADVASGLNGATNSYPSNDQIVADKANKSSNTVSTPSAKGYTVSTVITADDSDIQNKAKESQNALDKIPEKKKTSIQANTTGIENVKSLNDWIVKVPSKKESKVKADASGKPEVINLVSSIENVKNKDVLVSANTKGLPETNTLRAVINAITNKTVTVTANVSGFSGISTLSSSIQGLTNKTVYIDEVTRSRRISGDVALHGTKYGISSLAFASGTYAPYVSGYGKTKKDELALTGELGQEMVVNGNQWWTVGNHGAEFADIPAGSVVFDAQKTKELLSQGWTNGRGKAMLGGTAYADGSDSSSTASDQDFVSIRLTRLAKALDDLSKLMDSYNSYLRKNQAANNAIIKAQEGIAANEQAYAAYMAKANAVGLDEGYQAQIRDGSINIESITDENLKTKISDFQKWYEAAIAVKDTIVDLNAKIKELSQQKFDNIKNDYDIFNETAQAIYNEYDAFNKLYTERNGRADYNSLSGEYGQMNSQIPRLRAEIQELKDEEARQLKSGEMTMWSDSFYKTETQIHNVVQALYEAEQTAEEVNNAIRDLNWTDFNNMKSQLEAINNELSSTYDLFDGLNNFTSANAAITDNGITKLGLLASSLKDARQQVANYQVAYDALNSELSQGIINQQEYNDQLATLRGEQLDAAKNVKQYRDAIIDLVKEGIEAETNAFKKLVDARKEDLQAQKDANDYNKDISKQTSAINKVKAQISALSGDTTLSTAAKIRELQADLTSKENDLADTRADHEYEAISNAYDKELSDFEEIQDQKTEELNNSLADQNQAISDALAIAKQNYSSVYEELTSLAEEYGITLDKNVISPWEDAASAVEEFAAAQDKATANTSISTSGYGKEATGSAQTEYTENKPASEISISSSASSSSSSAASSNANGNKIYRVVGADGYLNVRDGVMGNIVGSLNNGDLVETDNQENSGWMHIKVGNGWYWVNKSFLEYVPKLASSAASSNANGNKIYRVVVADGYLNVRDGVMGNIVGSLNNGDLVETDNQENSGWMHIKVGNGWYWVNKSFLEYVPKLASGKKLTNSGLTLTDEAGLGSEAILTKQGVLRQLDYGDTVFSAAQRDNLWALSKINFPSVIDNLKNLTNIGSSSKNAEVNLTYGSLVTVQGDVTKDSLPDLQTICQKAADYTKKNMTDTLKKLGLG
jgi:DNA repair exonuclease SbcCD ATPase subunit